MARELRDKLTPVTQEDLIRGFWKSWVELFSAVPTKKSVWLLAAHTKLECGLKYVHNFNLGNIKSKDGDGYDYQYFECGEELPLSMAQKAISDYRVTIVRQNSKLGTASVHIQPKHPWCRFRAFSSLEDGVKDHLQMAFGRFKSAWPAVLDGDPVAYAHKLKVEGYYTADEGQYTKGLARCFLDMSKAQIDYESLPLFSEADRNTILSEVAASLEALVSDSLGK